MANSAIMLPLPAREDYRDNSMWVDEQMWGHRLWDSQSPWLLFLEFLGVAEASIRSGQLFANGNHPLLYKPYKRLHLRNILFNNEVLIQIAERYPDSISAWDKWLEWMGTNAKGVFPRDFSYLRGRFHSFQQFVSLVGILRGSAVESESNKRWSSRFVFPFGPNALYEDLNITHAGKVGREYIYFGRTGEIMYLMLSRSKRREELASRFASLLSGQNPWNKLLALFQPDGEEDAETRANSFLPYREYPVFDLLADDWLHVLSLELPGFDALPHLVTLGAFHLMFYKLRISSEILSRPLHFICEVVAPKKTLVRELSAFNYQQNNQLSQNAVEAYLAKITYSDRWQHAKSQAGAFGACKAILEEQVRWPNDPEDYEGCSEPEALASELRRAAIARHRQHVASVHRQYGRDVGLVSKRGTNRLRYAPTDSLLKTLVLANVSHRMEYKEFLGVLFARYGFVIGEREAERVLSQEDFDKKAFQTNSHRLEQRLSSLGMLRRLSDACAYVQNPLARVQS
jgi:hypothetical protein